MREKELTLTNEDARKNENKNGEKLKNLENLLDNVNQVRLHFLSKKTFFWKKESLEIIFLRQSLNFFTGY